MAIKLRFKIKPKGNNENNGGSKVSNPAPSGCNKRKCEPDLEEEQPNKKWKMDPNVKNGKMDSNVKWQCRDLLDELIGHRLGYAFRCPVDPVALRIPDYFTVITNPMDLGTIKSKLTANAYRTTQEFAADVNLTFSNAMQYNPPDSQVHSMAKELECLFLKRWKPLEAKWNHGIVSAPRGVSTHGDLKSGVDISLLKPGATAKSGEVSACASNGEMDLKKALGAAHAAVMKKQSAATATCKVNCDTGFGKPQQAKANCNANSAKVLLTDSELKKEAQCIEERPGATAKYGEVSACASNGEMDLKKALSAAHAAVMKKQSAAAATCEVNCDTDFGKPRQEAKANCDADFAKVLADSEVKKEAQCIAERTARTKLEAPNRKVDDVTGVLLFKELLRLCGCSLSFDPCTGAVLRDFKTGQVLNPLASIGLHLKKDIWLLSDRDYDDNVIVSCDIEEGEILE